MTVNTSKSYADVSLWCIQAGLGEGFELHTKHSITKLTKLEQA